MRPRVLGAVHRPWSGTTAVWVPSVRAAVLGWPAWTLRAVRASAKGSSYKAAEAAAAGGGGAERGPGGQGALGVERGTAHLLEMCGELLCQVRRVGECFAPGGRRSILGAAAWSHTLPELHQRFGWVPCSGGAMTRTSRIQWWPLLCKGAAIAVGAGCRFTVRRRWTRCTAFSGQCRVVLMTLGVAAGELLRLVCAVACRMGANPLERPLCSGGFACAGRFLLRERVSSGCAGRGRCRWPWVRPCVHRWAEADVGMPFSLR